MAPHESSQLIESPESPDSLDTASSEDDSSTSSTYNPLNNVNFVLEMDPISNKYVCVVDVSGLGIQDMDIVIDLPEDLLSLALDPEDLLETFLSWELPHILEALQNLE